MNVLKSYRYSLENALAFKPHLLDKEQEELVAKVDNISELAEQVFDSLRLEFEDVEVNGQKKTLNQATLNEFLKNKNRGVRKQATIISLKNISVLKIPLPQLFQGL